MITQSFKIINGSCIQSLYQWITRNGGKIKSIRIEYPTGDDAFYGDLSIASEIVGVMELGGLAGEITFTFTDDATIKISFYGSLPLKAGCYKTAEINLRDKRAFDEAFDTLADEVKAYVKDNSTNEEEAEDESF